MKTTIAILIVLGAAETLRAADEPLGKPPERALDRQLLEGLDRELLEGLPQPASPPARDRSQPQTPPTGEDLGPPGGSQNPLANIAAQMRAVERRMAGGDTSPQTQAEQKQILAALATLLEQAKKQGSGGQPKPGKGGQGSGQTGEGSGNPMPGAVTDSTNRIERGTKDAAETADVRDLLSRIWGHLPDKVRDQMQASLSEQFLPKYERLIEEYYKRLAEERPGAP
jgi:hypothetical protein